MGRGGEQRIGFSPRGILAVNEAVALASHQNGRHMPVDKLARKTRAPIGEVQFVAELLRRAGLVEKDARPLAGSRCPVAAFRWQRNPSKVSLFDIAAAAGEPFRVCGVRQSRSGPRASDRHAVLDRVLDGLNTEIVRIFKRRKLGEFLGAKH